MQTLKTLEKAEHWTKENSEKHPVQTMETEEKAEYRNSEKHPADKPTAKPEDETQLSPPLSLRSL